MEWFLYDSDLHHERAKGLTQDTTNFLGDIYGLEDYHLTEKKMTVNLEKLGKETILTSYNNIWCKNFNGSLNCPNRER